MSDVAMSTVNKRKRDNAGRGAGKAARNGLLARVFDPKYLPVGSTILTLLIMLAIGQVRYSGSRPFVSMKLFSNRTAETFRLGETPGGGERGGDRRGSRNWRGTRSGNRKGAAVDW